MGEGESGEGERESGVGGWGRERAGRGKENAAWEGQWERAESERHRWEGKYWEERGVWDPFVYIVSFCVCIPWL